MVRIEVVDIEKFEGVEVIIGQGNFLIFIVDDFVRVFLMVVLGIKFGIVMNEVKFQFICFIGNDKEFEEFVVKNVVKIGVGYVFVIFMRNVFLINVFNIVKNYLVVVMVYGVSENLFQVIVVEIDFGRSVLGVVDGKVVNKIEMEEQRKECREFVEKIGYMIYLY